MAGQPRPAQRQLAFLDVLLGGAAPVVELADPLGRPRQVGDDEADARIELALVPLDLRHHPARLDPALRLVAEAGEEDLRLRGRAADGPRQQVPDPLLQDRIGRQADGVADTLSLQQLVELGLGERRVAAEPKRQAALTVAGDHRLQHRAPAFGAMSVARPQGAAFQVAELIEYEQRMVTGTAEMAVPGRALLLAMGRALGTIHVEDDAVRRLSLMH